MNDKDIDNSGEKDLELIKEFINSDMRGAFKWVSSEELKKRYPDVEFKDSCYLVGEPL